MVASLRCIDLVKRLDNVLLSIGQVGMTGGINVRCGPLGEGQAHENQGRTQTLRKSTAPRSLAEDDIQFRSTG